MNREPRHNSETSSLYASGAIERGIREGNRLRGEAMRHAFGKMRDGIAKHF